MPTNRDPFPRVALGFRFHFVAAILPVLFLILLGMAFGYFVLVQNSGAAHDELELGDRDNVMRILAGFLAVLVAIPLTMYLLGLIGTFLFLAAPAESRAGGIAVLMALIEVLLLVSAALRNSVLFLPILATWTDLFVLLELSLFVISKGLFILYVRRLGQYLDRPDLGQRILSALIRVLLAGLLAGCSLGAFWLVQRFVAEEPWKTYEVAFGVSLICIVLLGTYLVISAYVQYVRVLAQTRRAILGPAPEAVAVPRRTWLRLAFALLLILLGGGAVYLGARDWKLYAEYQDQPQDLTLDELIQRGHGANRHVRVKNLRLCRGHFFERVRWDGHTNEVWVAVVPSDSKEAGADKERVVHLSDGKPLRELQPPRRVRVLIAHLRSPNEGPWSDERVHRPRIEAEGYEGAVMNGIASPSSRVKRQLVQDCPDTSPEEVILLDQHRELPTAAYVHGCLWGGGAALLIGLGLFLSLLMKPHRSVAE